LWDISRGAVWCLSSLLRKMWKYQTLIHHLSFKTQTFVPVSAPQLVIHLTRAGGRCGAERTTKGEQIAVQRSYQINCRSNLINFAFYPKPLLDVCQKSWHGNLPRTFYYLLMPACVCVRVCSASERRFAEQQELSP
jgi:hypothetical protein